MAARARGLLRLSLIAGIASSAVYIGADFLAAISYPDYHSFTSRAISELSAIGSPTRALIQPVYVLHAVFVLAFGLGVRSAGRENPALRITGGLLIALGALDLLAPLASMNVRGSEWAPADTIHIVATNFTIALIALAMWSAASAFGREFRRYSIASVAMFLLFGVLTFVDAARDPTPWLGITERICIGSYLLWQVVLAAALLRERDAPAPIRQRMAA